MLVLQTPSPAMPALGWSAMTATPPTDELAGDALAADAGTVDVSAEAPEDVGTMFIAAARARRRSLWELSCRFWSFVYAWIVDMKPDSTPKASCMTLRASATQFVVHEPAEITLWFAGSYWSSLIPMITVQSSPFAGAEIRTFLAPPARWALASFASRKTPEDSMTTSTPASAHGIALGLFSLRTFTSWPSTLKQSSPTSILPGKRP